jgi:hypothetical protein
MQFPETRLTNEREHSMSSTPILDAIRTAEMFDPREEIREHLLKDASVTLKTTED